jgi:hypothetical protein
MKLHLRSIPFGTPLVSVLFSIFGLFLLTGASQCTPQDADGDGWTVEGGDCDDSDASVYPGAPELCDGIDNNCDGVGDTDSPQTWYADLDGDGFGDSANSLMVCDAVPEGYVQDNHDCYDLNADAYPGAVSYWSIDRGDGSFDFNCNGSEELSYTTKGQCYSTSETGCSSSSGWDGYVPPCGQSGWIVTSCYYGTSAGYPTCYPQADFSQLQTCR